jgi:F-actin capping protein alpha subunit
MPSSILDNTSITQDIIALNSESGPDTIAAKAQYDASTGRYFIDASEEVNNHPLAAALKEQFNSYKDKFYSTEGLSVGVRVESKGNTLLVSMYTEGLDEANCHSSSWFSQWRIQAEGNSEALISGKVTLHACSYEGNNAQLHTVMDFGEVNITAKGNNISESLIAQILTWEKKLWIHIKDCMMTCQTSLNCLDRFYLLLKQEWIGMLLCVKI